MVINTRQVCCGYIESENAWCKGEIIEFPKHVSHQNFKHLQLETAIHEKGSWKNSLCPAYTEIKLW